MEMQKVDIRSSLTRYLVEVEGISPYSQSRAHGVPRGAKETPDKHEERTWRGRMHTNDEGYVVIPGASFKNCLAEAAKYLSKQIPGRGKSTYTKHFESGVMIMDEIVLPLLAEEARGERLFVPSDGTRGSGNRVWKVFPFIPAGWKGRIQIIVTDDVITQDILLEHLCEAGNIIGIGRFRPRRNGYYGRFRVTAIGRMADGS